MTLHAPSAVLVEDVETLFGELRTHGISCSRHLECIDPEGCGTDAATECLKPGLEKDGRVVIVSGTKILIFDPKARDQRKYLFGRVKLKAANKRSRCGDCWRAGITCPIAEDATDPDEDGTRARREVPTSPMSPLDLLTRNEIVEKALALLSDDEQRQALMWYIVGHSEANIARWQNKKPATIRKRIYRAKKKIARLFDINLRARRKR